MRRFIIGVLLALLIALFAVALVAIAENTLYGTGAGQNMTSAGLDNTIIGQNAATQMTIGRGNTLLGTYAGYLGYGTSGTVKLGYLAGNADTSSHKLFLTTGYYPAKGIFGDFSTGYFGVNTASPTAAWQVTGTSKSDSLQTKSIVATSYGILNGAGIFRAGTTTTGAASADTTKGTNAAFTGYLIANGATILRGGATVTGSASADTVKGTNAAFTGYGIINGASILRGAVTVGSAGSLTLTAGGTFTPNSKYVTPVRVVLADSTLMDGTSGYTYIARPVAAKTTITLPAAAAGLTYTIFGADADSVRVSVASGDSLVTSSGAAWVTIATDGGTVRLVAYDTTYWLMVSTLGTWVAY